MLLLAAALCQLKNTEAIIGLMEWCSKNTDQDFSWMKGIALKAGGWLVQTVHLLRILSVEVDKCIVNAVEREFQLMYGALALR